MRDLQTSKGSILIIAIWTLLLLSVFAIAIGLRIRQRSVFLSRIEHRSHLHLILQAGLRKAVSLIRAGSSETMQPLRADQKVYYFNNPVQFSEIILPLGKVNVSYTELNQMTTNQNKYFGVVDEDRKINLNTSDHLTMVKLFTLVLLVDDAVAHDLADAVVDWREAGRSQPIGFYSDDYYANLQYPYEPKNADFETLDEVKLLKGFSNEVYEKLRPFVTIYGNGQVNINTASGEVLNALGLNDGLADKIISVRRGSDSLDNTIDDYVFQKTYDIASEIKNFTKLDEDEIQSIDNLNQMNKIKTHSEIYDINATSQLQNRQEFSSGECVYDISKRKVEYWHEKY